MPAGEARIIGEQRAARLKRRRGRGGTLRQHIVDAVGQALRQRVQTAHLLSAADQRREQIVSHAQQARQAAGGDLAGDVVAVAIDDADGGRGARISAVGSRCCFRLESRSPECPPPAESGRRAAR